MKCAAYIGCLTLLGLILSGPAPAEPTSAPSHIVSGHWTAADGLPVDTIYSLAIDPDGQLWIATHDGLARFDGSEFTHFNADSTPAMPGNRIRRAEIAAGKLIVALENGEFGQFSDQGYIRIGQVTLENLHTDNDGLWYAEGEQLMRWEPDSGASAVAAFDGLELIYPDPNGERLFLSSDAPAVLEFKPGENRTRIVFDALEDAVLALATCPRGQVGVITRSSLKVIAPEDSRVVETIPLPAPQWDKRFLTWSPEGWLATIGGPPPLGRLMQISSQGVEPVTSAPPDFHRFVLSRTDEQGRDWLNKGTRLYRNGKLMHQGMPAIFDFQFDRYGQVWLGTHDGLKRISEPVMKPACPQGGCLGDPNTYLVTEHDNGLLIGNQSALYHHVPEEQSWTRLLHFHPMGAIADGPDLLVGGNGLCRLQSDGECAGGRPPPEPNIKMLMRDRTNAIWMGSDQGLFRRSPDGKWSDEPLTPAYVRSAAEMDDGRLALGTVHHGVLMTSIHSSAGSMKVIADTQRGLASNSVRSLHVLNDQRLLVGLEDRGMCLVDPGHEVERCISVNEGLPHHSAHRMIEDEFGRLWVNTNNGIYLVDIQHLVDFFEGRESELITRRFDTRDGMPSNEGNGNLHQAGTRTTDGRIWFPNQQGVVVIHPDRARTLEHRLNASITPIGHPTGQAISLPPEARLLRVRLNATALRGAESVHYRYRLGNQNDWTFIGSQQELTFESLAPGIYQLQVQARYSDGQWPEQRASLTFGVHPRLSERRGFWLLITLAGLLLLCGLLWRERAQVFRLERQVGERTAELSHALATVKAQSADIRRTANRRHQFFLAIGHELRTPLTLVLGPLRDRSGPPGQQQLERMRQSAEQMQTLIDQVLDLEQVEHAKTGDFQLHRLSALLVRAMEVIAPMAEARSIDVAEHMESVEPDHWVRADSAMLDRALLILLENAIKYAAKGGTVQLAVSILPDASHAAIHIDDNGPGIPEDQRADIFEPFMRGDSELPGLGLGPALCRRIIEQHEGTITVTDSALGGARFTLEIPLTTAPAKSPERSLPAGTSILVVDDNPGIRAHVADILAEHHEVCQAASAHEAERMARSNPPDVMLIDASMPQLNGLELLQRLRKDEQTADIPTILFTAHGNRDMEVRAFRAGADHYLEKPFTADQLLSRIERVLSRQQTRPPAQVQPVTRVESPDDAPPPASRVSTFMSRMEQALHDHIDDPELDVDQLATLCGTSRATMYRKLNEHRQATPADFIRDFRLRRAAEMLRQTDSSISEIAFAVGFRRQSAFTRAFRSHFNCTPSEYRKTHTNARKSDKA
ncbi:response regulator [Wenzhouxiangella sp. AB-CW3]|uniref:response regulator n=1 Tax=Wenzhouxiangella sp. AB-CW3 TaxID=2771012 RepID=UPI00168ACD4A|nr:response regulator [Wenzhouxiangella sp. AB-CW3]QOC23908.1 response regulator [Wenzhouxiangella sp. AB-CW3]